MNDYDFTAKLDNQISFPAYNEDKWETRTEWFDWCYENGYYWIEDHYNPDGTPKK